MPQNSLKRLVLLIAIVLAHFNLFGQIEIPVKWIFSMSEIDSQDVVELEYKAVIDKGWTIYSQYVDEGGPIPTSVNYENPEIFESLGDPVESGNSKTAMDPYFDMEVKKFFADEPFYLRHRIKIKDKTKKLIGYVTFMVCDDEKCLPPTDEYFEFDFTTGRAQLSTGISPIELEKNDGSVVDQTRPLLKNSFKNPVSDCGEEQEKRSGMGWMFIFGFLGGLLALLTPCVFPMIPLTVSYFTKDNKRKGWMNGLIYGVSIIVIYVSLGLILTLLFGEDALNRLSTNWIANSLFFLIFVLFAFSFFGFFEITLPSSWSTKSDRMADKGGLIGIFFMAFTLSLVSFSCTGPIIGTAIVQAATNQIGPAVVMLGFSLALALPFGLFAAFPAWLNSLPQSGSWMNKVKVYLGFIELALAFKFLSVADMTNHWGFLRYELFMGIWVLIALGMVLYSFNLIKFPHDSPIRKLKPSNWILGLASLGLVFYFASGFKFNKNLNSYNSLKMLSGLAPPANYNFLLDEPELDMSIKNAFPSFNKCANNIDCFKDYSEGMAFAQKENKPVLLDFTGYGCVNCRKTEEHIWSNDEVRSKLNDDFVLVSLYVDDDMPLKTTLISKPRQERLRNIGKKWTDFQILNFGQNSQPLYIILSPDETVLAPPREFQNGVDGYINFLDCGLQTYKSLSNL